jgi:radical SAM superfamily enzyme YgiQ (UPF0313 family)
LFEDFSRAGFIAHLQSLAKTPIMVGICVYTETANESLEIASLSKQAFPKTKVVLGGPHATFCYDELLQHECVDFVVRGEGESNIIQLLEYISHPNSFPLQVIPGIAYKIEVDGGHQIEVTMPSSFITCLDILPFPDYPAWSKYGKYSEGFSIVSSRGCPGQCIFCASRAFSGSKYRFHAAEWVFSMLFYYFKVYGFRWFVFYDDTLLANKLRAKTFCNYLSKYWSGDVVPSWACKSRADMVNEAIARAIKDAGCVSVHIGVESGAQEVLDNIKKGITLSQVFNSLRILKKHGIEAECSFILGHPGDTLETIEKTLLLADEIENLGMGKCVVGYSTPFPGTPLWNEAERLGIQIKVRDWSRYNLSTPVYETPYVNEHHLRKAVFYYEHQRNQSTNPGLSGSSQAKIDITREEFTRELRGEEEVKSA